MNSFDFDRRLCADEIFAIGDLLNKQGNPIPRMRRILVFRGKHAVHSITPIIGTPNVSVSYVSEVAMISALTTLFDPDFEFKYLQ